MKLFDIRTDDSHAGFIAAVNCELVDTPGSPYLSKFGPVGSLRWWASFDRGELPVEVLSGEVSHAGLRVEEWTGEVEDVIEFECGGHTIGYDRAGPWSAPIRVGDRVRVARTIAEVRTRTGPVCYLIDLWGEWLPSPAEQKPAEQSAAADRPRE